jgi:hypothetical protein
MNQAQNFPSPLPLSPRRGETSVPHPVWFRSSKREPGSGSLILTIQAAAMRYQALLASKAFWVSFRFLHSPVLPP